MPQVYTTPLKPASGGFGAWEWIESVEVEGCETYADYEALLHDTYGPAREGVWQASEDLAGRIRDERGRVYRLETASGEISYEMVWIDEEEL